MDVSDIKDMSWEMSPAQKESFLFRADRPGSVSAQLVEILSRHGISDIEKSNTTKIIVKLINMQLEQS